MEHRSTKSHMGRAFLRMFARSAESYPTRIMLSMCVSLVLLLALVNLPLNQLAPRIGWVSTTADAGLIFDVTHVEEKTLGHDEETAIMTVFQPEAEDVKADISEGEGSGDAATIAEEWEPRIDRIPVRKVLNFAEQQPEIVGGLSNYYLNIDYPVAAREQGIEGRLLLSFVVQPTGKATDIRVEQSLHPLCDSSAVAALEKSHFIPGRQNGERVAVRMRLPVLFRLIQVAEPPDKPVLSESRLQ